MDLRIQELGGFGVYRFLENLFHAFEALFEAATYSDDNADEALTLLQRIRKISTVSNMKVSRLKRRCGIVAQLHKIFRIMMLQFFKICGIMGTNFEEKKVRPRQILDQDISHGSTSYI